MVRGKFLDSSVVVALFRAEDTLHQKALSFFVSGDKFMIPDYVVAESLTVLKNREGSEIANKCADFLLNSKVVDIYSVQEVEFLFALDYFVKNQNKLSFVDTILLSLSEYSGHEIVTFDKELAKMV